MKLKLVVVFAWLLMFVGQASAETYGAEINFACGAVGKELEMCKAAAEEWAKKTGNRVRVYGVSKDASERLGIYRQMLNIKADFFDVIQIDVVWTGILGDHLLDLTPYSKGFER